MRVPTTRIRRVMPVNSFCSVATLLGAFGLLLVSVLVRLYRPTYIAPLIPILIVALIFVLCAGVYLILFLWYEYNKFDHAFCAASCEGTSMFENVLDGIL